MIALIQELGIGLLVFGGWFCLALLIGHLLTKAIKEPDDFNASHNGRPRLGLLEQDAAERKARVDRAMKRHDKRAA